ncbi:hypothetical protein MesoLj131b_69310 (plasmid) [Mesorhizobium sp. 131-2-5]|uniref:DUF1403 family protein n=1 Tax=Mesorhizobium sp. 131-2-5 TaxID=2744519 RepID=UPI00193842D3|nr:DUF1403 family protein [Mesorhizobium sp. 131-2-5]BCH04932.1 hypothetical protein MesoLj131b_69310 [Mesorhizobium sp. 131-2-5]
MVPAWLRRAVSDAQSLANKDVEDVAVAAGAALGALDAMVRRQERWAGAWRHRLALAAAAVTVRQAGRVEDEAALRDAVLLTKAGDDVGPAGLLLLAWRRLAGTPAEKLLTEASIDAVLDDLGLRRDDEAVRALADDLRQLSAGIGMAGMLTGAFMTAERHGFARALGAWLADALLAQRLGWAHAVPLLGAEAALGTSGRPRRSAASSMATSIETDPERAKSLLAATARAALRAIDLSVELERRADRLLAVAPKLRAKAADMVVEKLLSDDAVVASEKIAGMSDRGLRRLFDRLVELGAVRELSGRPAFRIYGL